MHPVDKKSLALKIYEATGYQFRDLDLLLEALTHPSLSYKSAANYERLEFLGDAVLSMTVSEMLYRLFPDDDEGCLTRKRTALVRGSEVVEIARSIGLGELILMSGGERTCGGSDNPGTLENALEALIGAMYMDGGPEAYRSFIHKHWLARAQHMSYTPPQDPKTALQEWVQGRGWAMPLYKLVSKSGPEHKPVFAVEVSIQEHGNVLGTGSSKKLAEQEAAKLMLKKITELP
ncbi:ribonuclease III [Anaplasma marginale]|uniref:Ribonuclease 3 n=1 Tax=Anaplasma marginale (strain Florida) TaxID=320483 RepID=RNC_ANAMF|nr:ribonuclease III [Anaplasma marginale]B9KGT5.1 RecName: Full=Ribonuclease 3; AltName: Full=Ribonuclease III; Short=RNase III [Anaplasma marginale str. Florida]ACM49639.1 ribonuclease III (rnc) [Anaplasma marginale str. Florida]